MIRLLLLVLLVGGILAMSNPGMNDFKQFVEQRTAQRIEEDTGRGALGRALAGAGARLLSDNAEAVTERTSYLVCSMYHVDLDGDGSDEWRYLGIARQFVELSPET